MGEREIYIKHLENVKNGYIFTLILSSVILAGAICCAVIFNVIFGLLLLLIAILAYIALTKNLLYKNLGIAYRAYHGCLTVTELYGRNREVVYIPDEIIMLTVTEIGTKAFTHESSKSIREIHIPKSIIRIGTSAFAKLPALTDLYYEGSEEEWKELSRLAPLENVNLHFNEPMPRLEKKKRNKTTSTQAEENNVESNENTENINNTEN